MSFSLLTTPGSYYSAHGDLIFVAYDDTRPADTSTYSDYKYMCDVVIGSNTVATLSAIPQPGNYFGVFNIGDIVRSYVASVFNPVAGAVQAQESGANEFFVQVTCKFWAEYSTGGVYTIDPSDHYDSGTYLVTDSQRTYFNHYNGRMTGVKTNLSALADKVCSNRPVVNYVGLSDACCFLPYFPTSTSSVNYQVKAYAGGTLQNTYNGTFTPGAAYNMQVLNVSATAVNATAFVAIIDAATTYYTVQVNGGTVYRFNITCEAVYTPYTLHFLNQYGGFESRNFTKLSRKTVAITKTDFGRLPYTIDASGNVNYWNSNNVYNETRSTYASQYQEKLTLNTDILADDEYTWLGDLILSPLVYIEMGGYFVPCAITGSDYEYRRYVNEKTPTNLVVNVEFGEQFNAQYR